MGGVQQMLGEQDLLPLEYTEIGKGPKIPESQYIFALYQMVVELADKVQDHRQQEQLIYLHSSYLLMLFTP